MSRYIARAAIRLSWGIRLYSLPSPEGGSQVYLMYGSGACPLSLHHFAWVVDKLDPCSDARLSA
jgi:hypothetical protein